MQRNEKGEDESHVWRVSQASAAKDYDQTEIGNMSDRGIWVSFIPRIINKYSIQPTSASSTIPRKLWTLESDIYQTRLVTSLLTVV